MAGLPAAKSCGDWSLSNARLRSRKRCFGVVAIQFPYSKTCEVACVYGWICFELCFGWGGRGYQIADTAPFIKLHIRSFHMLETEENITGTRMICTNLECGCELEIVIPCPHGTDYTCACGHEMEIL
jgi:hypothetical protein